MAPLVRRLAASGGPWLPGSRAKTNKGASDTSRDFKAGATLIVTATSAGPKPPTDALVPAADALVPAGVIVPAAGVLVPAGARVPAGAPAPADAESGVAGVLAPA